MKRRHFLRSAAGAIMALPTLPSLAGTPAIATVPAKRFALFYSPTGFVRSGFFPGEAKTEVTRYIPSIERVENDLKGTEGFAFKPGRHPLTLTPTLEPLAELQEHITLVTGLDRTFQTGTDVHAQCGSCFLSSAAPYEIEGSAWPLDRTLDHIIADQIGDSTPFRTLEFSANSHKDNKESIYFDNISWYGTGHVAPSLRDPRKAYDAMFGTGGDAISEITSLVLADANRLKRRLGSEDREKFEEYYESIREIELRVKKMERFRSALRQMPISEPSDAHLPRGKYMALMGDLMVAALQSGLTNVATFMAGPERWDTPFTFEELFDGPRSHHKMSHSPEKYFEDLLKLDRFHVGQFARLAKKMAEIREPDGSTLLDNTLFTFGSGLGDGATHQYNDLPIIVAGGGQTGGHLAASDGTPLANLWLGHARRFGVELERFADSDGEIRLEH